MINPKNTAIVFDIGNVCLKVNFQRFLHAIGFEDEEHFRQTPRGQQILKYAILFETGKLSTTDFLHHFAGLIADDEQAPEKDRLQRAQDIWKLIIGDELPHIADLVRALHAQGYYLAFLSDICPLHFALVQQKLSFFHLIPNHFLSYRIGCLKPHPDIFAHVEKALPSSIQNIVFTDDKEENVQAASGRGWVTHHFTQPEKFIQLCRELLPPF
ncbi:MAG: hypothetical protein D6820_05960 [Lentisphaerae bacterium]|nr:MAG: hypothetical protein D6820_05960 [Lentisphaerota bacterium]